MLTVERALELLDGVRVHPAIDQNGDLLEITNTWDSRFISEVSRHVREGNSISTAQGTIVLKLTNRYRDHLATQGITTTAVDQLLSTPQYDQPPYQSEVMVREVRCAGPGKLAFRCRYNQGVVQDVKSLRGSSMFSGATYPQWNREHKLWIVDVTVNNYQGVMDVITRHNFAFDDEVAQLFVDLENDLHVPSEVRVTSEAIEVTVRNDDLLAGWLAIAGILDRP